MEGLPIRRRAFLQVGGLTLLAGGLPAAAARAQRTDGPAARSCIFILLQGGPSHIDLWDPKPTAPSEIRGPYSTIETSVPGLRFGESVPRTAAIAHRLAVVRSMSHAFNNHIAGTYITLTGSDKQPNQDREAAIEDFPGPGAVLNYLQGASAANSLNNAAGPTTLTAPLAVSLPTWLSIPGPSNRMPGQYAGFLGAVYDPFLIAGDPNQKDYRPLALSLPEGVDAVRSQSRYSLRQRLEGLARRLDATAARGYDHLWQNAHELIANPRVREALDLNRESAAVRDRYGRTKIGQSLLLARRLVEAGVRLVSYNAFNQEWDTHGGLVGRYKQIVPGMDQAYAALVEDLAERGLLDQTLVVNTGEFGRTPVMNKDAGRDHWPDVYSLLLAGGGVRGGQVLGASDKRGAQPASQSVSPADLLSTVWHQLGIEPQVELRDRLNRPQVLSHGRVLSELL